MSDRSITPAAGPLDVTLRLPGAKSLCNRALITAALADGHSLLSNFLFADDTVCLMEGLTALGISVVADRAEGRVEIKGCAGHLPACEAAVDCGESGTMLRFCAALCATAIGDYHLHGRGRLHQRPMAPLLRTLQRMGTLVEFEERQDHAPLIIHARGLRGGAQEVDGSASSQFASAILLAGPCARSDVMLAVTGPAVSAPYLRSTCQMMRIFGAACVTEDHRRFIVPAPQPYHAVQLQMEPDASTAGYFLAAAALCGGRVRVEGLGRRSPQGDLAVVELLTQMGCQARAADDYVEAVREPSGGRLRGLDADLGHTPDLAPTIAVLALFADGASRIRNVAHLQYKESDRLQALASELARLGATIERHQDGLTIKPPARLRPARLDPHGDHRLAMALSLAGLVTEDIVVCDSQCVSKSFPEYFSVLARLSGHG